MSSKTNQKHEKKDYDKILKKYFGYDALKDLQYKIIKHVIDGDDVISLLPTSYGKSICYQMPYLITKKNVIVISPLISLMEDQMRELREKNIGAICLNSTNKNKEKEIAEIHDGEAKIIYTTPEYLANNPELVENLAFSNKLALVAIDECHCISNWGHSFRSDYKHLGFLKEIAPNVPVLALTATATDIVINDVSKSLGLDDPKIIKHSIDRPNLYIEIHQRNDFTLETKIVDLLKETTEGKTLIYCKTVKDTDKVAEKLKKLNFKCEAYHAQKDTKERTAIQKNYTTGDLDIIVSTIAFGMGINIPNIRLMIHYNCSNDVESYLQEIGRAGRDGNLSRCFVFWSEKDFVLSHTFLEDIKDKKVKLHKEADINYLKKYVTTSGCRRNCILKYFGEDINDCKNCDNCLSNRYTRNFTKEMYLLLSLMTSFNGNFGMNTYIKLLIGSKDKSIAKYAENVKNLFGKGDCYAEEWWKKLFGILSNNGYLMEEKIKGKGYMAIVIKPTTKGLTWFHQYKHGDPDKKPSFEISIPTDFQKIDKKKSEIENDKKEKEINDIKKTFGLIKIETKKKSKDEPENETKKIVKDKCKHEPENETKEIVKKKSKKEPKSKTKEKDDNLSD